MQHTFTQLHFLICIFIFIGIECSTDLCAQSIADIIINCKKVNGNVASSTVNITEWAVDNTKIERTFVQNFDNKKRLVSIKEFNRNNEVLLERNYSYVKGNMIKQEIVFLGQPQRSFFYQYNKDGIPLRVMEINPKRELLTISKVFLDSLYRPILLKNYDLAKNLLYEQIAQYDVPNNRLLVQNLYPKKESSIYQYQMCSKNLYLETIPLGRFESHTIKVLKTTKEKNTTTIVKAVTDPDGKEDIHIQEIEFDQKDNWIKSNLYRLKKRKQKKILLQQIERNLVYR